MYKRQAIDCVNSVGGIILPELLERLGVKHVEKLYCEPTGNFQHNPEPLEKNLGDIMNLMKGGKADVAFVVDPDVDRLAMICEMCIRDRYMYLLQIRIMWKWYMIS